LGWKVLRPSELTTIFERFHRATSKGEGAGLGLAIADSVVRGTHGVWKVENRPGGGARFEVAWTHAAKTK
jgi:signal transduction histidine kinase